MCRVAEYAPVAVPLSTTSLATCPEVAAKIVPQFFCPSGAPVAAGLKGKAVAVNPDGSGSRKVTLDSLSLYGASLNDVVAVPAAGAASAQGLTSGGVEAAIQIFIGSDGHAQQYPLVPALRRTAGD